MALLQLERISAQYPGAAEPVLADISLTLGPQQLLVALGPSGSGKTSLLNLIAGFVEPSAGRIQLDGVPVQGPSAERGVVFQDDALLPWQDVLGNVAFGLELAGVARDKREARAREMLALVDLAGFDKRRIWQLSGGQKQRVGLARALAADPRVLLMDEPFGALDAFTREQMQELLLQVWRRTAKPVFLITHDIEEAVFLATDLILLAPNPGQIVERLNLDFGQRYAAGESARAIKSDPRFIETREHVLARVFSQRSATQQQERP
ncbi:taurine ABC transporter ATP-binding subunit [Pseudomonas protegens]|jgi:taurine transport system ATP-binding protein|uniref:Taurine import ATP-binding protein TauB n=3 Tax=Pseudomonas protegens TaxID=380021 RepID=TAUB_PSEF5|nr:MULTISPECIES: taurine ABC transporter ATP-binding subunit [Pseudomonas]Q4KK16.1 RecName: Full=Taurine import ATP-binding protein TauB [Pseudomonas protegens Pf-5]BCQ58599.1 taurine import ATP-binding protein TauB [Pseudomonas sp. Boi14]GED77237.1 taurine import ATP-binding protein TauB [Pseudomonas fluorescens]AAY95682.1 taurine ABC transporter, ATP-binding protein [Pseudomonas protegens Pf-5]AGL82077.1 taurine import ATP-binding protein TauB [Pseudomonas protegens CHA0]AQT07019.1 taurine 